MLPRVKNKLNNKVYFFRFFSEESSDEFYYTETEEAVGFNYGSVDNFISLDKSWEELLKEDINNK